ncbi:MAG TPA: hypothetical protein VGG72_36100 [Bryobacteraceae bacterium]|jgi:hypothetical protein
MNDNLETKLREAFRRQDPPAGFAERVVYQAGQPHRPRPRHRLLWPAAAFAAAAALVFSFALEYRSLQEERAGLQTIEALQIVSQELNAARDKVLDQ